MTEEKYTLHKLYQRITQDKTEIDSHGGDITFESIDLNDENLTEDLKHDDIKNLIKNLLTDKKLKLSEESSAEKYIALLNLYRTAATSVIESMSRDLLTNLRGIFSSDSDNSHYGGKNRYFFELLQNADDAGATSVTFTYYKDKIEIAYDGKEFEPKDVYGITNYFESTKKLEDENSPIQIGEKGIGFKTVFGIADKATIHSGVFSFYIDGDNALLPKIDNEKHTDCGKSVFIRLSKLNKTEGGHYWYDQLKDEYVNEEKNGLLNRNPILFVNHIENITVNKIEDDETVDHFSFRVEGKGNNPAERVGSSLELRVVFEEKGKSEKTIDCLWYSKQYLYEEKLLKERYGEDFSGSARAFEFATVIPKNKEELKSFVGKFYSYFTTEIDTSVPLLVQAPYQLTSNREGIASNNGSEWFKYTNKTLESFLTEAYKEFADKVHEDIVYCIPPEDGSIFKTASKNSSIHDEFVKMRDMLLEQEIFWSEDALRKIDETVWVDWKETKTKRESAQREDEIKIFEKWKEYENREKENYLFRYPEGFSIPKYVPDDRKKQLGELVNTVFYYAAKKINDTGKIESILDLVEKYIEKWPQTWNEEMKNNFISVKFVEVIGKEHKNVYEITRDHYLDTCKRFSEKIEHTDTETYNPVWRVFLNSVKDLDNSKLNYLRYIFSGEHVKEIKVNGYDNGAFYISGSNALVINKNAVYESYRAFVEEFFLEEKDIRERYHKAEQCVKKTAYEFFENGKAIDVSEFEKKESEYADIESKGFEVLSAVITKCVNDLYNKEAPYRFLYELISNADRCNYPEKEKTLFISLDKDKGLLTLEYNEEGFSQQDRRDLCNLSNYGRGFFSLFSVAERVEILSDVAGHTGAVWNIGYSYEKEEERKDTGVLRSIQKKEFILATPKEGKGTKIFVKLNDGYKNSFCTLAKDDVKLREVLLKGCLCLRQLSKVTFSVVGGSTKTIEISDYLEEGKRRRNLITGNPYESISLERKVCSISGEEAGIITKKTKICKPEIVYYFPTKESKVMPKDSYYIYSGRPTDEKLKDGVIIDAPFLLDSSRRNVLDSSGTSVDADEKQCISVVKEKLRKSAIEIVNDRVNDGWGIAAYNVVYPLKDPKSHASWFDDSNMPTGFLVPLLNHAPVMAFNRSNVDPVDEDVKKIMGRIVWVHKFISWTYAINEECGNVIKTYNERYILKNDSDNKDELTDAVKILRDAGIDVRNLDSEPVAPILEIYVKRGLIKKLIDDPQKENAQKTKKYLISLIDFMLNNNLNIVPLDMLVDILKSNDSIDGEQKKELVKKTVIVNLNELLNQTEIDRGSVLNLWRKQREALISFNWAEDWAEDWRKNISKKEVFDLIDEDDEANKYGGSIDKSRIPGDAFRGAFYAKEKFFNDFIKSGNIRIVAKDYEEFASYLGVKNLTVDPGVFLEYLKNNEECIEDENYKSIIDCVNSKCIMNKVAKTLLSLIITKKEESKDYYNTLIEFLKFYNGKSINQKSDPLSLDNEDAKKFADQLLDSNRFSEKQAKALFRFIPQELKSQLIEIKSVLNKYSEGKYETIIEKESEDGKVKVKSSEELIIFERINYLLPKGEEVPVDLEDGIKSIMVNDIGYEKEYENKLPDFYINITVNNEVRKYYWEHLGVWDKQSYKDDNKKKLEHYRDVYCKGGGDLPRLTFPASLGEDKLPQDGDVFYKVTSSREALLEFLFKDPSSVYDSILGPLPGQND